MDNLIWIAGLTLSLSVFTCAVSIILTAIKRSNSLQTLSGKRPDGKIDRRKIKTNPNIVCGFPVYQKAREEAPFF